MSEAVNTAIIGAGAAGLMAGIWSKRTHPDQSVVLFDGADKLGKKILVAGGGRCNVTHYEVDATAYAGASKNAIKNILQQFSVEETVDFFKEIGVYSFI